MSASRDVTIAINSAVIISARFDLLFEFDLTLTNAESASSKCDVGLGQYNWLSFQIEQIQSLKRARRHNMHLISSTWKNSKNDYAMSMCKSARTYACA